MNYIVAAYTTAPSLYCNSKTLEQEYYKIFIKKITNIQGLEIPYWGNQINKFGDDFIIDLLNKKWKNILTCIPGTVLALKKNKYFGLASPDPDGRKLSIMMHKKASNLIDKILQKKGMKSFVSVIIASAPSNNYFRNSTKYFDAFKKSLDEIINFNWNGCKIILEHCDSYHPKLNKNFEKGFMPIENELNILNKICNSYNVGLGLNWARSVIEGKSISSVVDHIKMAKKKNLLRAFTYSGVAKNDKLYGKWKDNHMPFSKVYSVENYEKNSLLNKKNIKITMKTLADAKLDYVGIKLQVLPRTDYIDLNRMVGVNLDAIHILNRALNNNYKIITSQS
jgi:hypothetical protein